MTRNKIKMATALIIIFLATMPANLSAQPKGTTSHPKMVILITLDTVRSDHTTYMGYPRNTTPFLNELARKGVLFKKMRTPIPFTTPSHEAIFSALSPQHQDPALYQTFIPLVNIPGRPKLRLLQNNPTQQTLPQILKENGYETAAFTAVSFMDIFQKKFDYFQIPEDRKIPNYQHSSHRYTAEEVVDNAIAWLRKTNTKGKRFIWMHFFDAHYPYIKALPYRATSHDPDDRAMISYWKEKQGAHLELFKEPQRKNIMETFNNYDGALQYIDSQIKRIYSYIEKQVPQKDTLWIIIPDHGEGLTSHYYYNHHKELYEEQLLTPAIMVYQGIFEPHADTCDATNTDILPTVASIIGHQLANEQIDGDTLIRRLTHEAPCRQTERMALAVPQLPKLPIYQPKTPTKLPIDMPDKGLPPSIALYDGPYKYIYNTNDNSQLYNIEKDPSETTNLAQTHTAVAEKMKQKAQQIYKQNSNYWKIQQKPDTQQKTPTDRDKGRIQQLRSLGY